METIGALFTLTVADAEAEQPPAFVPVTEYVVVDEGLTVMLAVVWPVLQ
jgi:hypothetical protein